MLFTIKDAESLSGIKSYTLRIWEKRYGILNPKRSLTKIRYYSSAEIKSILNISLLNKHGFKISHIAKMSESVIKAKIISLDKNIAGEKREINELLIKIIENDFVGFEKTLNTYFAKEGLQYSVKELMLPYLERAECTWQMKGINDGVKHFISNIIKQKIAAAIEEIKIESNEQAKRYCLFLPEQEYNDVGLLASMYLFKSNGMMVVYMGANTSINKIQFIARSIKPDVFCTHFTKPMQNTKFQKLISEFNKNFKHKPLIISGRVSSSQRTKIPSHILLKSSLSDLLSA